MPVLVDVEQVVLHDAPANHEIQEQERHDHGRQRGVYEPDGHDKYRTGEPPARLWPERPNQLLPLALGPEEEVDEPYPHPSERREEGLGTTRIAPRSIHIHRTRSS